jgi:hypothetical protein
MKISSNYVLAKNMDRIKRLYQARLDRKAASQARGKAAGKRSARPAPQEPVSVMARERLYSVGWEQSIVVDWGFAARPCPACRQPMELKTHDLIYPANQRPQLLSQKCYHTSWWFCTNRKCSTGAVYDKEFMVVNKARNWKCVEEV